MYLKTVNLIIVSFYERTASYNKIMYFLFENKLEENTKDRRQKNKLTENISWVLLITSSFVPVDEFVGATLNKPYWGSVCGKCMWINKPM